MTQLHQRPLLDPAHITPDADFLFPKVPISSHGFAWIVSNVTRYPSIEFLLNLVPYAFKFSNFQFFKNNTVIYSPQF